MSCTLTLKHVRDHIGEEIKKTFPSSTRTSHQDKLTMFIPYDAANPNSDVLFGKTSKMVKKYNKDYKAKVYGNIVTRNKTRDGELITIHPSRSLLRTMNEQNDADLNPTFESIKSQYEFMGDIYPTRMARDAAMQRARQGMAFMSNTTVAPDLTNYNDYIKHKEALLVGVTNTLENNKANRKINDDVKLKLEISELYKLKEKLESEIHELTNAPDIFQRTMSVFNKDLAFIDKILSNPMPTIENIQYAEKMVTYFKLISDYSSNNKNNNFVSVGDSKNISPDVLTKLNELKSLMDDMSSAIYEAKMRYLLQAINESENLKALYPGMQLEEIRTKLLESKSDIGVASLLFATVDKEFTGEDSSLAELIRLELERTRDTTKPYAVSLIQAINDVQDAVKTKLKALGYGINSGLKGKLISEVSYDLFYQKSGLGDKTGALIGKYSHNWFKSLGYFMGKNAQSIKEAWEAGDGQAVNGLLAAKYNWINDNADFIEIGKLPEIINNPNFSFFAPNFKPAEADAYKRQLISKIGEYTYNKLVQQQTSSLEDFTLAVTREKIHLMDLHKVANFSDLNAGAQAHFHIFQARNNPFELLKSHDEGRGVANGGRIGVIIGQTGNEYQHHLKYNTFIPKKEVTRYDQNGIANTMDSGNFDSNFDTIEQDADLLKFWETLSEATEYMNGAISDSRTSLQHNSLLKMSKSVLDLMINPELGVVNKAKGILKDTGQTLSELFSTTINKQSPNDVHEVNKAGIETIQKEVEFRFDKLRMEFNRVSGLELNTKLRVDTKTLTLEASQLIENITGYTPKQLQTRYKSAKLNLNQIFKDTLTNQVMEEQTYNLPVMMRAYLDIISDYKAQKEALPKINIYKNLYDSIELKKKEATTVIGQGNKDFSIIDAIVRKQREAGTEDMRPKGQLRVQNWINKNVKGLEDKDYWGAMGRNLSAEQKEYEKEALKYIKYLDQKASNATNPDQIIAIENEIAEIKYTLENLGSRYALGTIYNTMINRLGVFLGLGWKIPAAFFNRFQGWYQGMINDNGRYWTEGNFYSSNAFINRKGARLISPKYRNEITKVKLLTEKMGYIQDNTNQLDRAKRKSGVTSWVRKLNPFYLTEYVEWHNQVPQALAILMDQTIQSTLLDANGNPIQTQIFDGTGFPAYNIVNGELVLKSEYRTPENIATWENFSDIKYAEVKAKISDTIALLNGDYSKTGSTYIKNFTLGKSLMMFKTWLPNQIFLRFAKNQTSITLGVKDFDGAYVGALSEDSTRSAATMALGVGLSVAAFTTLGLGLGILTLGGLSGYSLYKNLKARKDGENLETMKQLSSAGRAIIKKAIGLPVNTLSGKNIIAAHQFQELNITETDKQNLQFIVNEVVAMLYLLLAKVLIKSMFGDDDEEEPKTLSNGQPNPYYGQKQKKDKFLYNVFENTVTRLIDESSQFYNVQGMYQAMAQPAGIDSWLDGVGKLSTSIQSAILEDDDTILSGSQAGSSKLGASIIKMTLPGITSEWAKGDFTSFGFKTYGEREWKPGEVIDPLFKSDYKADLKAIRAKRVEARIELTEYWSKEFQLENETDPAVIEILEKEIKKRVNQELEVDYSLKIRGNYDENQERIE